MTSSRLCLPFWAPSPEELHAACFLESVGPPFESIATGLLIGWRAELGDQSQDLLEASPPPPGSPSPALVCSDLSLLHLCFSA